MLRSITHATSFLCAFAAPHNEPNNDALVRQLHLAIGKEHVPEVSSLLGAGVSTAPARSVFYGAPPLHHAVITNNSEVVQLLLRHGANIDATDYLHGSTALHAAAARGFRALALELLAAGVCRVLRHLSDHARDTHLAMHEVVGAYISCTHQALTVLLLQAQTCTHETASRATQPCTRQLAADTPR